MGSQAGASELLERDRQLAEIERFLTAPWPASLVVHGAPGIGKSTIVAASATRAAALGVDVWAAGAAEAERTIAFATLDVVIRCDPGRDPMDLSASPALATALEGRVPAGVLDTRSMGLELSVLLARGSEAAPLLLVIDDAQWIDPTSAQVLAFALRRVQGRPVAVLLATRPGGLESSIALTRALSVTDVGSPRPTVLAVGPLTAGATGRMVRQRLGVRLSHGDLIRLHDACGGNPLIALELARLLVDGEPVTGWEQGDLIRRRVAGLDEAARMVVAVIGLVGEPELTLVEAVLADRGISAMSALSSAIQADVVVLRADRLRASHPLLARAAVDLLPDKERRSLHAAIAAQSTAIELVAVHTARACQAPESRAAALLAEAAELCASQGATVRAAELAGLSVEFTPGDDPAELARQLLRARLLLRAGEPTAARAVLHAAERVVHRPAGRLEVLLALKDLEMAGDDRPAAHRAALAALAEAGQDPGLRARCHAAIAGCTPLGVEDELAHAHAVLDLVDEACDPSSVLTAIQTIVTCQIAAGDGIDHDLLSRVDALRERTVEHTIDRPEATLEMATRTDGDLETARRMGALLLARARADGDETARPYLLLQAASTELRDGDAVAALRLLDEADELSVAFSLDYPAANAYRAQALALAGELAAAEEMGQRGVARAHHDGSSWDALLHRRALGLVALLQGNLTRCTDLLAGLRTEAADAGVVEPAFLATDLDLVDALAGLGDLERLNELVRDLEVVASGGGLAWTRLAAARGQVQLAAAAPAEVLDQVIALCDQAAARVTSRYEHARADLAAGRALQRRGRRADARTRLGRAQAVFDSLGALGPAAVCSREVARLGGRAPSGTDLTASERQVVDLAARGLSNREIAEQLVIGARTVETHLSSAYRKLGVPGRKALIRMHSPGPP